MTTETNLVTTEINPATATTGTNLVTTEINPATATTGNVRSMVMQTLLDLRAGRMDAAMGMAFAANVKVLNDNMLAEVAMAKMEITAKNTGNAFGSRAIG